MLYKKLGDLATRSPRNMVTTLFSMDLNRNPKKVIHRAESLSSSALMQFELGSKQVLLYCTSANRILAESRYQAWNGGHQRQTSYSHACNFLCSCRQRKRGYPACICRRYGTFNGGSEIQRSSPGLYWRKRFDGHTLALKGSSVGSFRRELRELRKTGTTWSFRFQKTVLGYNFLCKASLWNLATSAKQESLSAR